MSNNKTYIVYLHSNKINNKKYIGVTSQSIYQRWRTNGEGYKRQEKFYNAIKKYGWNNFDHIILAKNLTKEEAASLERKLIQQYDTIKNGYNLEKGGFCQQHSQETIEKIRRAMIGKTHTTKTKEKISKTKTTGENAVLCIETNKIYMSPKQAFQETGIDQGSISKCCRGIALTAGGYHWKYTNPKKYNEFKEKYENRKNKAQRKVKCVETQKIFNTATEAAQYVGAETTNIVKACRGKIKTSKGYHWEYADEK